METAGTNSRDQSVSDFMGDGIYENVNAGLIRLPLLPIEAYKKLIKTHVSTSPGGKKHSSPSHLFDPDFLSNSQVRLALALASPAFFDSLEKGELDHSDQLESEETSRKRESVRRTLMRYLIRMSTRPTPFGLFAGVGLVNFGDRTSLWVQNSAATRSSRLDIQAIQAFVKKLESDPAVYSKLKLVRNFAVYECFGSLVVNGTRKLQLDGSEKEVSLPVTDLIDNVMEWTRRPIDYRELESKCEGQGIDKHQIQHLLRELIEKKFLFTDLMPSVIGDSPAKSLASRLDSLGLAETHSKTLDEVLNLIDSADSAPLSKSFDEYRNVNSSGLPGFGEGQSDQIQTDAKADLQASQISEGIAKEAATAAELLLRLSPHPKGAPTTEQYRSMFLARYGLGREVPLLELLDPNIGLGPYSTQILNAKTQSADLGRNRLLTNLACRAIRTGEREVVLDKQLVSKLETWSPEKSTAPISLDINVLVDSHCQQAVDRGHFRLVVGPSVGSSAAGRGLARFAHLFGPPATDLLNEIARKENPLRGESLAVELIYLAPEGTPGNVMIRPRVHGHELRFGLPENSDTTEQIRSDEIVVGIRNDRFYLHCPRLSRDISIVSGHMFNPWLGPDICNFLSAVSSDGQPYFEGFSWGQAESFPFLPRVRCGRIVLRLAEWKVGQPGAVGKWPTKVFEEFSAEFLKWRIRWNVPRFVFLTQNDNRLLLDLEHPDHVNEIRHERIRLGDRQSVLLQEALPAPDENWVNGTEGNYYAEITVPLILKQQSLKANGAEKHIAIGEKTSPILRRSTSEFFSTVAKEFNGNASQRIIRRKFGPGSSWLYLKIYCGRDFIDNLIVDLLPRIAEPLESEGTVDKWFFIRYSDPDPHLRLRLHGEPNLLFQRALPHIAELLQSEIATGPCQKYSIETYEPEVERYGGPVAIDCVEDIFCADSSLVLRSLRGLRNSSVPKEDFAVLSIDMVLGNLLANDAARHQWLVRSIPKTNFGGDSFRRKKESLRRLLSNRDSPGTAELPQEVLHAFGKVQNAFQIASERLSAALAANKTSNIENEIVRSLIHMHLNRLFGVNPFAESRILELLRRTRESLMAAPFRN